MCDKKKTRKKNEKEKQEEKRKKKEIEITLNIINILFIKYIILLCVMGHKVSPPLVTICGFVKFIVSY